MLDPDDGGTSSRKLWFSVGTGVAITGLGIAAGTVAPGLGQHLGTVIDGLLMVLGTYCAANVGHKFVYGHTAKNFQETTESPSPVEPELRHPEPLPPQSGA